MSSESKRLSVTIPPHLENQLDLLKKERFYNESYSEMLRYLIVVGLQKSNELRKD